MGAFLLDYSPFFSVLAGIGAAVAAFFSWRAMKSQERLSKKQGEITTFNEVSSLIFIQKQHFYSTLNDLYNQDRPWLKSPQSLKWQVRKAEWDYINISERRNYLNTYEYACGLYQSSALDKKLFRDVFKDDIIFIYEKDFGKDVGISVQNESYETFEHLRKTYKELKDNPH